MQEISGMKIRESKKEKEKAQKKKRTRRKLVMITILSNRIILRIAWDEKKRDAEILFFVVLQEIDFFL